MSQNLAAPATPAPLAEFLARQERIGLLRFLTCGSVDDGKSTLIGRLLYDTKLIFEDQLATLQHDSRKHGTTGDDIDFALLVDGLQAEREQGITIDVAYRFFTTERRRFIVADTPGHEQYTRNMATGASNAELAVVLVDARHGVLTQTRRHSFITSLLGIRHIVLAVNKIDLVDFDQGRFNAILDDYRAAVAGLGFRSLVAIPLSARFGDNVIERSTRTPWYTGPTLLEHLETVDVDADAAVRPFRMPVQWVNRPNLDFRGYSGTIASGTVRRGDRVSVAHDGRASTVTRIVTMDGELERAGAGSAVTLVLADQIDISRGDVLATPGAPSSIGDQFDANLVWLTDQPLFPGRSYIIKLGTRSLSGTITRIRHRTDVNTFEQVAAETLGVNDVALVSIALTAPMALERFAESRELGGFIVIDRLTNATVGVGMIETIAQSATNIVWHQMAVDKEARAAQKRQRPAVLWFTGLSGAGKSTIADLVDRKLHALGHHTYILDGDNVRHGLNRDLGFSEADRVENIRRAAEAARLMVDAGLIVMVSFISPYRSDRDAARERFEAGEFIEVFIDTPIDECRRRDPKGLYARADAGKIRNFTGVDAPYEAPAAPELRLRTAEAAAETLAERVIEDLRRRAIII
ncbi:MAG: sulfate adenylyltransferase subunit CysN [Alphaproteobacteria bacterium]|nr:sulfate adenylyltransferase subunit CysN [Alphaproteobacteria bacterium]